MFRWAHWLLQNGWGTKQSMKTQSKPNADWADADILAYATW